MVELCDVTIPVNSFRLPPPLRRRVLVVEDDSQLAHLYCTALTLRGFVGVRVSDGLAALRSLERQRPDAVLLDLRLPIVDGATVLREFAGNPLTSDIPIIVCTGVDPLPVLPHAVAVLPKPCDPHYVARLFEQHLSDGAVQL
jgi:CheY-like chemotaxis protein